MSAESNHGDVAAGRGYEQRDVRPGWLAFWFALLVALMAGAFVAARVLAGVFARQGTEASKPPHPMSDYRRPPSAAPLQVDPLADLAAYQAAQRELLSSYGWIDPAAGVVRVPIERAMELVVEEGLPVRPEGAGEER